VKTTLDESKNKIDCTGCLAREVHETINDTGFIGEVMMRAEWIT
jgi:hypothetical protein